MLTKLNRQDDTTTSSVWRGYYYFERPPFGRSHSLIALTEPNGTESVLCLANL
jgi:hypothetical protein